MLNGEHALVLASATQDALRERVVRFAQRLEFDTVSATLVVDAPSGGGQRFFNLHNTPQGLLPHFLDRDVGRADPVAQHCKLHNVPIVWDQSTYVAAKKADFWEHQAQFGYRCGISLALHLPAGTHMLLGVDRDQPLPAKAGDVARLAADLHLFAAYVHEAAVKLFLPRSLPAHEYALTKRERECLGWTMDGKTAWEVGQIVGISEQTAARHLHHAARKLGCVNKHQAVLKALRLGLIG